ncbi:MAG: hypothetical protein ABF312_02555 [Candidatus Nanopelagicales bacterium]
MSESSAAAAEFFPEHFHAIKRQLTRCQDTHPLTTAEEIKIGYEN